MAKQPTHSKQNSAPADPQELTAMEFRVFLEFCPNSILEKHEIPGYAFWGVGMALAQHIDYKTGTRSRLSQRGMANISRTSQETVKRVIGFLKMIGAVEVVGHQRRNGKMSENYRLRKSAIVADVLDKRDQNWAPEGWVSKKTNRGGGKKRSTGLIAPTISTDCPDNHTDRPDNHTDRPDAMIRAKDPKIDNQSGAVAPSPTLERSGLTARARVGDPEEKEPGEQRVFTVDELVAEFEDVDPEEETQELVAGDWLDGSDLDLLLSDL